jgi:hypothetical protein
MPGPFVYDIFDESAPIERFVQETIDSLKYFFAYPFRDTFLEYWLLHPSGQAYTFFLATLLSVSIWLLVLNNDLKAVAASEPAKYQPKDGVAKQSDIDGEEDHEGNFQPSSPALAYVETPIMRELAPAGYRPVNEHLEGGQRYDRATLRREVATKYLS